MAKTMADIKLKLEKIKADNPSARDFDNGVQNWLEEIKVLDEWSHVNDFVPMGPNNSRASISNYDIDTIVRVLCDTFPLLYIRMEEADEEPEDN